MSLQKTKLKPTDITSLNTYENIQSRLHKRVCSTSATSNKFYCEQQPLRTNLEVIASTSLEKKLTMCQYTYTKTILSHCKFYKIYYSVHYRNFL